MESLGDFGSMDTSSYNDALNTYQENLNSALDSVASLNASREEKVEKFNQALQGTLTAISGPVIAKGFGKSFQNLKSAIQKKAGQAAEDAENAVKEKASQLLEGAKTKVNELVNKNPLNEAGEESAGVRSGAAEETSIDDAIADASKIGKFAGEDVGEIADTSAVDEALASAADPLQSLQPGFRVLADVLRRPNITEAVTDAADDAIEGATSGAKAAAQGASEAAENVAKAAASTAEDAGTEAVTTAATAAEGAASDSALAAAGAAADTAAAAEGGMNPIADLAALGVGLGMLFTGLFAKKHKHTVPPPPAATPTFSFGV